MNRTGLGTLGISLSLGNMFASENMPTFPGKKNVTAEDINLYLRSLCEVNEPSVDRIIVGDPETIVKKIGTAWLPYWETCREAVEKGVDVLVVHEPTFYSHWDLDAEEWNKSKDLDFGENKYRELRDRKREWINKNGLVIIRCHDVWDKIPDIGIPYAFGQALGFSAEDILRQHTYYHVYKTEPAPAIDVARSIALKLESVGQPGVAFYGDENYTVRSVGVGTGCICDPMGFAYLEPDLFIAIDDSVHTWIQTTYAEDTGIPLVVVNHGTSEEFGIKLLSEHLKNAFPDHEVIHFKQGCTYKWVTA